MPTDPRLLSPRDSASAADELLDRAIRHDTYLLRFSAGEAKRLVTTLERETLPDLRAQIAARMAEIKARGYDAGPSVTARLKETQANLEGILRAALAKAHASLSDSLQDMARAETTWQADRLRDALPVGVTVSIVPAPTLRTLVSGMPVRGKVLEDWFGAMERGIPERVVSELRMGIMEGQTLQQMARRIDPILDATASGVEATVRTFVTGVSAQTREATFRENEDIIAGVRWTATLSTACIACRALDGNVYPINEGPRPPLHPNCKCSPVPELKSLDELARKAGFQVGKLPPRTRASLEGPVPDSPTAEQWLKRQSRTVIEDSIGPARAEIWRKNPRMKLSDFVDALTGRPLTLDELVEREGITLN